MSDEQYLAKPSGECCARGTLHSGEPRGIFETIAEVETYVSRPPSDKANGDIVLYFPDVWGMSTNSLLVMDAFVDAGYLTLGLDYFRGDPVWKHRKSRHDKSDPNFDYEAWKSKHIAFADATVPAWVEAVKAQYGSADTKYACVGYCFGAPYVCNELAGGIVTAGAFAHPAFLKDHHFSQIKSSLSHSPVDVAILSAALFEPLFLSCAEIDHTFDQASRRHALELLQEGKKIWHLQLFSGVEHGFALRGDPDDPYQRWVKEQSLSAIVDWFNLWLLH